MSYELCKRAGLNKFKVVSDRGVKVDVFKMTFDEAIDPRRADCDVILASEVEAMLQNAQVVEGRLSEIGDADKVKTRTVFEMVDKPHCTHQARLVMIEKIERESLKCEFQYKTLDDGRIHIGGREFANKRVKITIEEVGE